MVANCQNLTTCPTRSAVFCYNISYNFHQYCNFRVQLTNPCSTMPASDSEDFESADEGISHVESKERKKRSSSNYSDKSVKNNTTPQKSNPKPQEKSSEGWDDFDIDVEEDTNPVQTTCDVKDEKNVASTKKSKNIPESNSKDTGWDDFDDWGQVDEVQQPKDTANSGEKEDNKSIKDVTDRLAESSNKGWGWGWGVDSLLSTASAGITTLTSQVSQGISTVLESSIGAPDPEELARLSVKEKEKTKENQEKEKLQIGDNTSEKSATDQDRGGEAFQFGSLLSGVTKFVETTGSKVISGGLDTLETIGKKTMEVLQDGDPGLAKKRAMLGLDPSDKPVLSQVLREAKARADEEDKVKEAKREAKEVHYENLFDDFEGLVHLEALEMLSRQVSMRIEERIRTAEPDKRQDIKETLQQVAELCEMPEEDDDDVDSCDTSELSKSEALHERLQTATQDLGLKLTFQPIVKQYEDITTWLTNTEDSITERSVYAKAVSGLAQSTASAVELYHKTAEMLLVKTRRSTADESDAMTQMTVVLTKHISELATVFTEKLNSITIDNKEQVNTYITNIFLEAGNSSTYIQNAFQLTLPILQIGAV